MVECAEFLDSYSDFRDGCLAADRVDRFEAHLRACGSCARYDRVVGGGVQVFRSLPPLAPSPDFERRLLNRLYTVEAGAGRHGSGVSLGVTLMICLILGGGAWLPTLRSESAEPIRMPPIVAHAPYHDLTPVLMRTPPPRVDATAFHRASSFYGQGLFFEQATPVATLAYRPASTYYLQR